MWTVSAVCYRGLVCGVAPKWELQPNKPETAYAPVRNSFVLAEAWTHVALPIVPIVLIAFHMRPFPVSEHGAGRQRRAKQGLACVVEDGERAGADGGGQDLRRDEAADRPDSRRPGTGRSGA